MLSTTEATAPTLSLARFIEDVRALTPVDGHMRHERLPDGRIVLVFRVLDEGRAGDVCVAGPQTRAQFKNPSGVTRAVMLQFKPGWSVSLFGVAANELTDRIVPLADLWGRAGTDLYEALVATRNVPDVVERVSRAIALQTRSAVEPASARLARRAVHLLEDGEMRVMHVAERLGVTARHLRRAFIEHVGIGPKDFARTVRLQRALRMTTSSKDWVSIAAEAGYCDQAHLINDFRELVGVTPGAYLKRADSLPNHREPAPSVTH